MPSYVISAKCTGCGDCVNICPSHIMRLTKSGVFGRKAVNIEPESCWECYNCVKHCPQGAVQIRGYIDFTPLGGAVEVYRDEKTNRVYWTIRYRNGTVKYFIFPIRTTPWGSIKPPQEAPEPPKEMLRTPYLSFEHEKLGGNKLGVELPKTKVPEVVKVEVRG
ncbi:MAG: adenylyl-sulfate reductase subunit beta [Vulcanisaeta sp.]